LTAREIDYLISSEWAKTADDILWRRTKLGLLLTEAERLTVANAILNRRQVMVKSGSISGGEQAA
jgi:glycerol-3-phosphate dehydrogenase